MPQPAVETGVKVMAKVKLGTREVVSIRMVESCGTFGELAKSLVVSILG